MNITDVKIFYVSNADPLKAFARVIIDDCFLLRDIRIIDGKKGLFVAMPSRRDRDGNFRDIVHPINQETREWFERLILDAYKAGLASAGRGMDAHAAEAAQNSIE
jgi:stage V sporulation protein G